MKYADILRGEIEALEVERAALSSETEALATVAETEARSLNVEEDARITAIIARGKEIKTDVDAKIVRVGELDAIDAERAKVPASPAFIKTAPTAQVADAARMDSAQATDLIVRQAEERGIDPTNAKSLLKRHRSDTAWIQNLAARATDVYESAFQKCITGREMFLTSEERAAIAVGTNTQGGFLVPTHLDPTLILTNAGSGDRIRTISRVVTLTSGNVWRGVTSAGSDFSWDAELAEVSDDSPVVGSQSITVHAGKGFIQASIEAFEDIPNLASDVLMLFADGKDRLEGAAHATGSGTGQPFGIFTALDANTNVERTSTTAATIGLVDLQAMKRAVPVRFRGNGSWVYNPVYGDAIKALGTALSASYSTDITQDNTPTLLGRPAVESDDAPAAQTTTVKDNEIVFGDFSNYVIVDKPGSTAIEFIPMLFNTANNLPDGRKGWFMHFRSGADSVVDTAFSLLQDKTSA